MNDPILSAAEANRQQFIEEYRNYGLLLNTMSPEQFGHEIGASFPNPRQGAIIAVLMGRLMALEAAHGEDPPKP